MKRVFLSVLAPALFGAGFDWQTPVLLDARNPRLGRDARGALYLAAGPSVLKLAPGGRERIWRREVNGVIGYMAVGADGSLALSVQSETEATILRWRTDGEPIYSFRFAGSVAGLAMNAAGEVFVGGFGPLGVEPTPGAVRTGVDRHVLLKLLGDGRLAWRAVGIASAHMAFDRQGNIVVAGSHASSQPASITTTPGAYQPVSGLSFCGGFVGFPCPQQFLTKITGDGSRVLWATWLTGGNDTPRGVAIAEDGSVVVAGTTSIRSYPVTSDALVRQYPSRVAPGFRVTRDSSGFVSHLSADGTRLLYSTFVGGTGADSVLGLSLAPGGVLTVVGGTSSTDFPGATPLPERCSPRDSLLDDPPPAGTFAAPESRRQGYVARLSGFGRRVEAVTRTGGSAAATFGLAVDPEGTALVLTASDRFDLAFIPGGYQEEPGTRGAGSGTWLGAWRASAPEARTACVVDAASFGSTARLVPGQLVTLFGRELGPAEAVSFDTETGRAPLELAGVRVLFDGLPAPVLYAGEGQVNVVAPFSLPESGIVQMTIERNGEVSGRRALAATRRSPQVFGGAVINDDGTVNSRTNPAELGSVVSVFLNGLGRAAGVADGVVSRPPLGRLDLKVEIEPNFADLGLDYAGPAAGQVSGVWQVSLRLRGGEGVPYSFRMSVDGVPVLPADNFIWVRR